MDNKENICPLMEAAGPLEASSSGSSAAFKPSSQAALGTKGPRAPLKDITHLYSTEVSGSSGGEVPGAAAALRRPSRRPTTHSKNTAGSASTPQEDATTMGRSTSDPTLNLQVRRPASAPAACAVPACVLDAALRWQRVPNAAWPRIRRCIRSAAWRRMPLPCRRPDR